MNGFEKMHGLWKWCGAGICGLGLLTVLAPASHVAADDGPAYERPGDTNDRLDRISTQLERLLNRMEARRGPGPDGPPGPPPGRPEWGGPSRELPPEARERMQQAREEMKDRMEKAREKFRELEERVKTLEAEVERLKSGRND